jgi:tetratricopeptide (TPR) repeat protein
MKGCWFDAPTIRIATGNLLQKKQQVEEAHYFFRKALSINPNDPVSLYNQAAAYQAQV